jgi:hypothetical protein
MHPLVRLCHNLIKKSPIFHHDLLLRSYIQPDPFEIYQSLLTAHFSDPQGGILYVLATHSFSLPIHLADPSLSKDVIIGYYPLYIPDRLRAAAITIRGLFVIFRGAQ